MSSGSKNRPSDQSSDLRAERETFVRNFLHKGVELTEDLIRENQSLEQQVRQLKDDNTRLRAQLAGNDAIRELLGTIEALEHERKSLLSRSDELAREFQQHEARHSEIETELNNLASLYVASFQLNGTLSIGRVVRHMCELLEQLVGAQSFVVYIVSADGKRALPIGSRGMGNANLETVSAEDGPIGDVNLTGVARINDPQHVRPGDPVAVLPLIVDAEVVGVIAISKLLPHKRGWVPVDQELFKLLASQGATALIAANLYVNESGARTALRDIVTHMEAERIRQLTEAEAGGDA